MARVVHEMKDGEWLEVSHGHYRMRSGDVYVAVFDSGCGSYYQYEEDKYGKVVCALDERSGKSRDAAMLAAEQWLEQQDKLQWIDLPSGLAAMCEWRGFSLTAGICTNGNGWWFHIADGLCGGADQDQFLDLDSAKSAAEAWVRAQTGGAA